MKTTIKALLLGLAAMFAGTSWAEEVAVEKLEFAALPGNQMEVRLGFNATPPQPTGYAIEKPARIALDLVGAKSKLESKHHNLGTGNARSMTVVEARDRTRVIINLNELVGYNTRTEGNTLVITIGDQAQPATAAAAPSSSGAAVVTSTPGSGIKAKVTGRGIAGIDFRRTGDGEGQVVVSMSSAAIPVDVRQDGGRIIVEFLGATLPETLRRKLDVTDFATPVTNISTSTSGENVVMVIQPKGQYDYLAYQADKEMIIGVKPITVADQQKRVKDNFLYSGEKLSLNFQDIEVRSVLQLIADFTSLNLVASDTVSGRITLRLQNVPWDQALDLVLKTKGLDKRQIGNVLLVAPADEIAARERLELEAFQQAQALAPLRSEFVQINYATAVDIAKLLKADKSVLTSRGSISVDDRTNTLIIVETAKKLEEIRDIIGRLDVAVRQVLIEARIVLATTEFAKELGVKWGVSQSLYDGDKGVALGGSTSDVLNQWAASGEAAPNTMGQAGTRKIEDPGLLAVDMGVTSAGASKLAIGLMDLDSNLLELELSALASDGHGEIVATPKVLTTDQQEALIASGTQVPYQEASSSGATTTSFKDAELKLKVKPQITPDGKIIMSLTVNNDSLSGFTPDNLPLIATNRLQTVVLVNDGDTLVLGGIFKTESANAVIKTPFLGDLPVLSRFFRKDVRRENKAELLIFITPRIVKELTAKN
ncbi:MAG: type IV pilus secretin PilQ [Pseudomonadota bacterium]